MKSGEGGAYWVKKWKGSAKKRVETFDGVKGAIPRLQRDWRRKDFEPVGGPKREKLFYVGIEYDSRC